MFSVWLLLVCTIVSKVNGAWSENEYKLYDGPLVKYDRGTVALNEKFIISGFPTVECSPTVLNCGEVKIMEKEQTNWAVTKTLKPSFNFSNQFFGSKVAISNNNVLVTGLYSSFSTRDPQNTRWSMRVFVYEESQWNLKYIHQVEGAVKFVSVNDDGVISLTSEHAKFVAEGDRRNGNTLLFVFSPDVNSWSLRDTIEIDKEEKISDVKLTDGHILISYENTGVVEKVKLDGLGYADYNGRDKIIVNDTSSFRGIDMHNGEIFVGNVGHKYGGYTTGAVVSMVKSKSGTLKENGHIVHPTGNSPSTFGTIVKIDGDYMVVGSYGEQINADNPFFTPGCLFLFEYIDSDWALRDKVYTSKPMQNGLFGYEVDMQNRIIVAKKLNHDPTSLIILEFDVETGSETSSIILFFVAVILLLAIALAAFNQKFIVDAYRSLYKRVDSEINK